MTRRTAETHQKAALDSVLNQLGLSSAFQPNLNVGEGVATSNNSASAANTGVDLHPTGEQHRVAGGTHYISRVAEKLLWGLL